MDPTAYPDINDLLRRLLGEVAAVLRHHLVGMYLEGSLATGDFDPASSDIDLVVVTDADLPAATVQALRGVHARLAAGSSRWSTELECSYVPRDSLRHHDPRPRPHPRLDRGSGELAVVHQESGYWVIHRHVLREHGIALVGPAPSTFVDPVAPADLRRAVSDVLREWWVPMLDAPARLRSWGYRCYAVLTMCRMLYTLHHGTIVSKQAAARWSQDTGEPRWHPLIRDALAWSREVAPDFRETLAFICHTHAISRKG